MTLITQLTGLTTRIATEFKKVHTKIGDTTSLLTTDKTNVVAALNEIYNSIKLVAGIDDTKTGISNTWSSVKVNTELQSKAPLVSPTFTGTVTGISKAMVGLGNVNNTADTDKPVSTLQKAALDLKAPITNPTFTGTVSGITKAMVGLSNVDNTSDMAKPVSVAQSNAINAIINDVSQPTAISTTYSANKINSVIDDAISGLVSSAPGTLDTINEIANALGSDANYATSVSEALSNRLHIDGIAQNVSLTNQFIARTNIGAQSSAQIGDTNHDFVVDFESGLS